MPAPSTPTSNVTALVRAGVQGGVPALEDALVRAYLRDTPGPPPQGELLQELLIDTPERHAGDAHLSARDAPMGLSDLVKGFELLIPSSEAQQSGAVFTPSEISAHLARTLLPDRTRAETATVLDPSCGCGALLLAALERIHALTGRTPAEIVRHQLFGVDLSADSVRRASILLTLGCRSLGDPTPSPVADNEALAPNLVVADSLSLDWEETFPDTEGHFDVIIGNPPYVRYQHLTPAQRTSLAARWSVASGGNFNLYFVFFELACERLTPTGRAGYISPNNFFASASGAQLRAWLGAGRVDEIVDFGHEKVFDALTYTALTFFSAPPTSTPRYAQPSGGAQALAHLTPADFRTLSARSLARAPWRLTSARHAQAIDRLGTGRTLDDVAEVRYGVKTCRDRVYLLTGPSNSEGTIPRTYQDNTYEIEAEVTRTHACVSDLRDETALQISHQRIIYPYEVRDGRAHIIPEEQMAAHYPGALAYLRAARAELAGRDKGHKTYATWYAYGRTQGLVPLADKLLTPEYAARPRFLRDQRPDALFSNGCAVTPRALAPGEGVPLDILQQILTSGVCHYYISQTSTVIDGGYHSYQKTRLTGLAVPRLTKDAMDELRSLRGGGADDWLAERYQIVLPGEYRRGDEEG